MRKQLDFCTGVGFALLHGGSMHPHRVHQRPPSLLGLTSLKQRRLDLLQRWPASLFFAVAGLADDVCHFQRSRAPKSVEKAIPEKQKQTYQRSGLHLLGKT
mmetsp:Transcript_145902/g.269056  ORF Transcript_145902/g.269056 Transcript_145902/m.269056 type:complete len:101 (+) Transcript_145902:1243-1545(+)